MQHRMAQPGAPLPLRTVMGSTAACHALARRVQFRGALNYFPWYLTLGASAGDVLREQEQNGALLGICRLSILTL